MRPDAVKAPRREGVLVLEAFLPYRLSVLSNIVSGRIAKSYAERFSLTVPEWRVMAVLGRFPGLMAGEVTERTAMDKVQVSRAVARLLKTKRIERRVVDGDRRARHLFLTGEAAASTARSCRWRSTTNVAWRRASARANARSSRNCSAN